MRWDDGGGGGGRWDRRQEFLSGPPPGLPIPDCIFPQPCAGATQPPRMLCRLPSRRSALLSPWQAWPGGALHRGLSIALAIGPALAPSPGRSAVRLRIGASRLLVTLHGQSIVSEISRTLAVDARGTLRDSESSSGPRLDDTSVAISMGNQSVVARRVHAVACSHQRVAHAPRAKVLAGW